MTQEGRRALLSTAWNLTLLYMILCVYVVGGVGGGGRTEGLCVYEAGRSGMRGFLKKARAEPLNF